MIMARAANKAELIAAANEQWNKMWKLIDAIPGGARSAKSLTNLTPHPFVVFWRRSHPTPPQRIAFIRGEEKAAAIAGK
jgi:Zn-dependent protease with chaperone function